MQWAPWFNIETRIQCHDYRVANAYGVVVVVVVVIVIASRFAFAIDPCAPVRRAKAQNIS